MLLSCRRAASVGGYSRSFSQPVMLWSMGAFSVGSHTGLSQLKTNTQEALELLPSVQWFAVRKYGMLSLAQLFTRVPVHTPPPIAMWATERISFRQRSPSGQMEFTLHGPLSPKPRSVLLPRRR